MAEETFGYAVVGIAEETILVRTVHTSERGAIVNYLVSVQKTKINNSWSDEDIYREWSFYSHLARVMPVKITLSFQ